MDQALIHPDQTWLLWAILLVITAVSIYLESKYAWAQKITGAIIGLIGAVILTNLKVIPMESPVYDTVWEYVIPLSIPMLLFKSNMKRIFRESGKLMILFIISGIGTIVGAIVAHAALKSFIPELAQIAGIMTGSYMGGGVNFVALSSIFNVSKTMISAATVADNFNMALYFIVLLAVPKIGFFRNNLNHPYIDEIEKHGKLATDQKEEVKKATTAYDIAMTFATATTIVAVSNIIADFFDSVIPTSNVLMDILNQLFGNSFLIITTLTMILATLFPKFFDNINGTDEVGNFLIYIFFVVIGVPASIPIIIKTAPLLLVFCFIMVLINMLITFAGAKIFNFNMEDAIIASNANIGGPATASAMAISQGWTNLIGPGIFVGLFGYIVGNYFGTIVGNFLM
ncbi:MAG: DUF819 family protein [Tissierellia bacterium]|nr:DUF819 family protein [Tissierellia bacterium]